MESINGGKNEKFDFETELGKAILQTITRLGDKFDKYLDLSIASELEDRSNRLVRRDRYDRIMEIKCQIEELRLGKILEVLKSTPTNGKDLGLEDLFKSVSRSLEEEFADLR